MDYIVLKNEIDNDPTSLGYGPFVALGSDDGVAQLLNDKTKGETLIDNLSLADLAIFLAATGLRAKLNMGAASPNPGVAVICETALELLVSPHFSFFHVMDPNTQAMMDALIQAGVFEQADKTNVMLRATRPCSRAEKLFGAETFITGTDIAIALRGNQ